MALENLSKNNLEHKCILITLNLKLLYVSPIQAKGDLSLKTPV